MSCCLILQSKNAVCIGADTAVSTYMEKENRYIRRSNDGKKLFEMGKDIVFCSGDMSYAADVINHIKIKEDGHVDAEHISRYMKGKTYEKCPVFNVPSIGLIICSVINNVSYVHSLEVQNNFDVVTHVGSPVGLQVWVSGIYSEKCLEIATGEVHQTGGDVISTYINTYKRMACNEIGGAINVYYLDSSWHQKVLDNYDLNDGYVTLKNKNTYFGVLASAIVGEVILGEKIGIYSKDKAMTFDARGFRIKNDVNSFVVDPSSKTMLSLSNSQGKIFYVDDTGELHIKGNGKALDISANSTISNMSTKIDNNTEDISDEILRATTAESSLSSRITQNSNSITLEASKVNKITESIEDIDSDINTINSSMSTISESVASLEITADSIQQSVSKKVGEDELISKINMSSEAIKLSSNRLIVDSENFKLDKNGNVAFSGDIVGSSGQFTKSFEVSTPIASDNGTLDGYKWVMKADADGVKIGTETENQDAQAPRSNILFKNNNLKLFCSGGDVNITTNRGSINLNVFGGGGRVNIQGELYVNGVKIA